MPTNSMVSNERRLYDGVALILGRCYGLMRRCQRGLQKMQYRAARTLLFHVRADDVFIVSYPKAGTTVLQMMVYQILTDGDMSFRHIDTVVPWFDMHVADKDGRLELIAARRAFKTHLAFPELPRGAVYIYAVRDPKDSCVSYYHHLLAQSGERLTMAEFGQRFLAGDVPWGSWFEHFVACSRYVGQKQVLTVRYEDIVDDLPGVVQRVGEFLGHPLAPPKLAEVVERCTLAFMKAHNEKFDPRFAFAPPHQADFIRRGINGGWVDELSPDLARAIDRNRDAAIEVLATDDRPACSALLSRVTPTRRGTLAVRARDTLVISDRSLRIKVRHGSLDPGDVLRLQIATTTGEVVIVENARVDSIDAGSSEAAVELSFESLTPETLAQLGKDRVGDDAVTGGSQTASRDRGLETPTAVNSGTQGSHQMEWAGHGNVEGGNRRTRI